ncbi:MAG: LytTR family DNA-binding domain-containing protein [Pseudomonadota bacterium]
MSFFLLVPLALAALSATETGYNRALGYGGAMLYLSHLALIPWWIAEGTTRLVWIFTRRYRPPLWLTCGLGALIASAIVSPYVTFVTSIFESFWPIKDGEVMLSASGEHRITEGLVHTARAVLFWTGANYIFDRFLGYERFRETASSTEPPASSPAAERAGKTGLLKQLRRLQRLSEIDFVKAEEHYVRVHGRGLQELVTCRFGSALKELEVEDGFQVHRSFWVRTDAIVEVNDTGRHITLLLRDGSEIPVSKRYHALVRQVL